MIEERAVILSLEKSSNNSSNDFQSESVATIEIERKTACGLCGQTRGCGNSIWGKLFGHQTTAFKAQNSINAKVGQSVVVGINETAVLKGALLLYIVPLFTLFVGALLASHFWQSDGITLLGAAAGLVSGLLWVKGHTLSNNYFRLQQPVILRLAANQDSVTKIS